MSASAELLPGNARELLVSRSQAPACWAGQPPGACLLERKDRPYSNTWARLPSLHLVTVSTNNWLAQTLIPDPDAQTLWHFSSSLPCFSSALQHSTTRKPRTTMGKEFMLIARPRKGNSMRLLFFFRLRFLLGIRVFSDGKALPATLPSLRPDKVGKKNRSAAERHLLVTK